MENNNQEISEKVATFRSHYGAMMFRRRYGEGCKLKPVPRSLSSSCGTAAFFYGSQWEEYIDENVEVVYEKAGDEWRKLYGEE